MENQQLKSNPTKHYCFLIKYKIFHSSTFKLKTWFTKTTLFTISSKKKQKKIEYSYDKRTGRRGRRAERSCIGRGGLGGCVLVTSGFYQLYDLRHMI